MIRPNDPVFNVFTCALQVMTIIINKRHCTLKMAAYIIFFYFF